MIYYSYVNGKVTTGAAVIDVNDLGLLRSYAVFDYLRTYNGKPFLLEHHLQRFINSSYALHLPLKLSKAKLTQVINGLLKKCQEDVGIRILLSGGNSEDGITLATPNLIITIEKLVLPPSTCFTKGIKLMKHEYMREIPLVKTTNYMNAIRASPEKLKQGAFELLYHFENRVLETSRNNFFIFKENKLITPKFNVLQGVTRKLVLYLAADDFEMEERNVELHELKQASEAFITGTTKKILPVVKIDEQTIGNGLVGRNTKILMDGFQKFTERSNWKI